MKRTIIYNNRKQYGQDIIHHKKEIEHFIFDVVAFDDFCLSAKNKGFSTWYPSNV